MLLCQILDESIAISADGVAGSRGCLFGSKLSTSVLRRIMGVADKTSSNINRISSKSSKRPKSVAGIPVIQFNEHKD